MAAGFGPSQCAPVGGLVVPGPLGQVHVVVCQRGALAVFEFGDGLVVVDQAADVGDLGLGQADLGPQQQVGRSSAVLVFGLVGSHAFGGRLAAVEADLGRGPGAVE